MKTTTFLKAALAAVTLVGATAHPVSAHGPIRYKIFYFNDPTYTLWAGEEWVYCDRHRRLIGSTGPYSYNEPQDECP